MPFLFILGNFNKSTKPRVSKYRAALSGREPRALLPLWMTSTSRQVAGAIWMPILFLEALLGLSLSYIVQDTAPILHTVQLVRGNQDQAAAESPELSTACLKMRFAGGGNQELQGTHHLLQQVSHPSTQVPSPDLGGHGGPCPSAHCHAPPKDKDTSACTNIYFISIFLPCSCRGKPTHALTLHVN